MPKKITTEQFIEKARKIHGDKYDYSKVEYTKANKKVCIICPEHGEFWQVANTHLNKCGCPECGRQNNRKQTTEDFIKRAIEIHGDKYDYTKTNYKGAYEPICIICPVHGEFWQTPTSHLNGKHGCKQCAIIQNANKKRITQSDFIEICHHIHNNKYDYSKVKYIDIKTKVCIICPEHGEFWVSPDKIIHRHSGCPKCGIKNRSQSRLLTTEQFIEKARKIHGDKYDYSKVEYTKANKKVCIICPEHGEFWMSPNKHLNKQSCPKCNKYSKKEIILYEHVKNHYSNKIVISNYTNKNILGKQSLDIFLPNEKIAIEYQGAQHFKPISIYGGYEGFLATCNRDKIKYKKCLDSGIKLFYFTYNKNDVIEKYIDDVITEENELFAKMDELIN